MRHAGISSMHSHVRGSCKNAACSASFFRIELERFCHLASFHAWLQRKWTHAQAAFIPEVKCALCRIGQTICDFAGCCLNAAGQYPSNIWVFVSDQICRQSLRSDTCATHAHDLHPGANSGPEFLPCRFTQDTCRALKLSTRDFDNRCMFETTLMSTSLLFRVS